MKKSKRKISQSFQRWLLFVVAIAFIATTSFLWVFQTRMAEENAFDLLRLNINDVEADISDASDENLLDLANMIAGDLNQEESITSELLYELAERYDVPEINYINRDGIITATTYPDFMNFDMRSGEQSAKFLPMLRGGSDYVQEYGPVSYDSSLYRKYGAVKLKRGGFVQVGYDAERFHEDISETVNNITSNRHVGENGFLIIVNEDGRIVSDRHGYKDHEINVTGLTMEILKNTSPNKPFETVVFKEESYCIYEESEGYVIIGVIPQSEAALSRNLSVRITTIMEVIVFVMLFIMIYILVRKLVVNNIHKINGSLSAITEGNLETVVDVRSHEEFDSLSDDINATVDTLKHYIADAEARIDAELAFAKAIQHSALPSVFPPYPNRSEFDIWATMHTAKEVGGDFYDFYFVDEDKLAFLVADVSGKGIPAAMFMMTSKTMLKSYAESGMSVEEVFTAANEKLCENNEAGMFVTAWMGILDTNTGMITYANAGHNPPLVRHADGSFAYLKTKPNFILAGMEGIRYRKNELQLKAGDTLYLYTDGVTEATDSENHLYGEGRLQALLNSHKASGVQTICDAVKADVDNFAGEAAQFDDITMLCLKYKGDSEQGEAYMKELTIEATVENIAVVTDFVNEQLEIYNCPLKAQMQIDIAIDELFGNIAHYAYNPDTGVATVRVEVKEDPLAVVISFIDEGVPFDPLSSEAPDTSLSAEEREVGGLGIFMVKNTMDEITYEYKDGHNILKIKKNI